VTALNTGMRLREILKLKWEEVDFENGIIYVMDSKNGEQRQIPMNNLLTETLREIKLNQSFPTSITRSFETVKRKVGIKDFHDLRRTFVSRLVRGGVDLVTVKELLGYKTIDITLRLSTFHPSIRGLEGGFGHKLGTG